MSSVAKSRPKGKAKKDPRDAAIAEYRWKQDRLIEEWQWEQQTLAPRAGE